MDACIETFNDHRIVLAAIVASKISSLNVSLTEFDSVAKSFPEMKLYL
jgi:5-enolpyruvylshikimate-3-phosphate synthase